MPWQDRALPTLMRLNRPPVSPPLNSIGAPIRGSGDALPRITATTDDSFIIAFKERSSSPTVVDDYCSAKPGLIRETEEVSLRHITNEFKAISLSYAEQKARSLHVR